MLSGLVTQSDHCRFSSARSEDIDTPLLELLDSLVHSCSNLTENVFPVAQRGSTIGETSDNPVSITNGANAFEFVEGKNSPKSWFGFRRSYATGYFVLGEEADTELLPRRQYMHVKTDAIAENTQLRALMNGSKTTLDKPNPNKGKREET